MVVCVGKEVWSGMRLGILRPFPNMRYFWPKDPASALYLLGSTTKVTYRRLHPIDLQPHFSYNSVNASNSGSGSKNGSGELFRVQGQQKHSMAPGLPVDPNCPSCPRSSKGEGGGPD
jgi:hypothetical protein